MNQIRIQHIAHLLSNASNNITKFPITALVSVNQQIINEKIYRKRLDGQ